jgi:hypothetical protein
MVLAVRVSRTCYETPAQLLYVHLCQVDTNVTTDILILPCGSADVPFLWARPFRLVGTPDANLITPVGNSYGYKVQPPFV